MALDVNGAFCRVQACRKIIKRHINYILAYFIRIVRIVSQSLHVSHEYKHAVIVAGILKFHPAAQRSNIVSEMQFSGRTVAGQYNFSHFL